MAETKKNTVHVYLCDPNKNNKCEKTDCQTLCLYTTHKEFRKDKHTYRFNGKKFVPIEIELEVKEEEADV